MISVDEATQSLLAWDEYLANSKELTMNNVYFALTLEEADDDEPRVISVFKEYPTASEVENVLSCKQWYVEYLNDSNLMQVLITTGKAREKFKRSPKFEIVEKKFGEPI